VADRLVLEVWQEGSRFRVEDFCIVLVERSVGERLRSLA
jgi:hypothetical protein